jgi:non-ribosomal peptide synthetase component E (peptide arylation enzyme)
LLSLVHVLEWRAADTPACAAVGDRLGFDPSFTGMTAATERSAAEFAAANITSGDVAVISIPDGRRGEIVRAVVVPRLALDTRVPRGPSWLGRDRQVS